MLASVRAAGPETKSGGLFRPSQRLQASTNCRQASSKAPSSIKSPLASIMFRRARLRPSSKQSGEVKVSRIFESHPPPNKPHPARSRGGGRSSILRAKNTYVYGPGAKGQEAYLSTDEVVTVAIGSVCSCPKDQHRTMSGWFISMGSPDSDVVSTLEKAPPHVQDRNNSCQPS